MIVRPELASKIELNPERSNYRPQIRIGVPFCDLMDLFTRMLPELKEVVLYGTFFDCLMLNLSSDSSPKNLSRQDEDVLYNCFACYDTPPRLVLPSTGSFACVIHKT